MSKAWDNALITELESFFTEAGMTVSAEMFGDRQVLVSEYGAENAPEDCNVSVEHLTEDSTVLFIMFTVRSGLDAAQTADVLAVLPYLNKYLSVGCFGIAEADGYFYFSTAMVLDEQADHAKLIRMITATLGIAEATVYEAIDMIAPVLEGETPVSGLLNEDTGIIQF